MKKEFTTGYFLQERHIEGGFKLLKKQIEQKSPLYNTLDFRIYREENKVDNFDPKAFYENYIKNDVFYYFQDKFYVVDFLGVQSAYKNRNYQFLSFEVLVLYNSIGLYIQEVLSQYQCDFDAILKRSSGQVFYGGKLNYKHAEKSTIFYFDDYQKFLSAKEDLAKPESGKVKYVLTVDIKSFFYTINHKILLSIIQNNATNVTKKALRYDENTVTSIEFFLKYLMKSSLGIPVSSQNLVSSYLSSIYFSPFDQYLHDSYLQKPNISYIRYVDDFYIIYEIDDNVIPSQARNDLYNIENDISDFLCNELNLSVSSAKSKRTKIDDLDSYFDFLAVSHSHSPSEVEFVEVPIKDIAQEKSIEDKSAPQIFEESIEIVEGIKNQLDDFQKIVIDKKDSNYLNNILIHKEVLNFSKSKKALDIIKNRELFLTYNSFDYLLVKLKVFLHLLTSQKDSRLYFHNLMKQECENSGNINQKLMLIERFILQLEFLLYKDPKSKIINQTDIDNFRSDYKNILSKFVREKPNNLYAKLVYRMLNGNSTVGNFKPIYRFRFLNKEENTALMQQMKQRHLNEKLGFFNVAFNHLLNEFQNVVEAAYFEREEQTALNIRDKLNDEGFKVKDVLFVSDFFKRRNQNSISHTNYPELGFWGVSEKEYYQYKAKIIPLIKKIVKKIK